MAPQQRSKNPIDRQNGCEVLEVYRVLRQEHGVVIPPCCPELLQWVPGNSNVNGRTTTARTYPRSKKRTVKRRKRSGPGSCVLDVDELKQPQRKSNEYKKKRQQEPTVRSRPSPKQKKQKRQSADAALPTPTSPIRLDLQRVMMIEWKDFLVMKVKESSPCRLQRFLLSASNMMEPRVTDSIRGTDRSEHPSLCLSDASHGSMDDRDLDLQDAVASNHSQLTTPVDLPDFQSIGLDSYLTTSPVALPELDRAIGVHGHAKGGRNRETLRTHDTVGIEEDLAEVGAGR